MSICYVELDGEMVSRTEYCRRLEYNYVSIANMMSKYNLTFEEAVKRYLNTKRRTKFDDRMKDRRLRKKWRDMMNRCYNPKNPSYPYYGGRKPKSIRVCEKWHDYYKFQDDLYESFVKHVEEYGLEETTLDRWPDKLGNYEPSNIRWATRKEQMNNVTTNTVVTDGLTAKQFAEKYDIDYNVVLSRLQKGWSVEKIVNTPVEVHSKRTILSTGETIPQFAKRIEMSVSTVKRYLDIGYTLEEIASLHITNYVLPCGTLKFHCDNNGYNYFVVVQNIKRYNLRPHEALARYLEKGSSKLYYLPCNDSQTTLRKHCMVNNYNYSKIVQYIKEYNLQPHEALAKWLQNRRGINHKSETYKTSSFRGGERAKIILPTGETLTEFSKRTGISRKTLESRIRRGWSLEKIVNTPLQEKYSHE